MVIGTGKEIKLPSTSRVLSIQPTRFAQLEKYATDIHVVGTELFWLPVETRVPLKFGSETLTSVTCARVCVSVALRDGRVTTGWGETPLSVQWAWPSSSSYATRHAAMKSFCGNLAKAWSDFSVSGHALEIGYAFQRDVLPALLAEFHRQRLNEEPLPYLAALVCCSAFDLAIHDAYGRALNLPIFETLTAEFLHRDLAYYLQPSASSGVKFAGQFPADFLVLPPARRLPAWHLVGGLDPLTPEEVTCDVHDGHPILLSDWIARDGLNCLKVKLRGNDSEWDFQRLARVGAIAIQQDVAALTADFNCMVTEPAYVVDILDRLAMDQPEVFRRILYVEQPFPYDLHAHLIDVRSLAAKKPLLMDESAHDWEHVRFGHSLGWNGVALKTCKTQTGALLSSCWAQAHNMHLMVQDLTNPMLAQIPHVLLAAHTPTMMGVETNAMQFYPEASAAEASVHPGILSAAKWRNRSAQHTGRRFWISTG